MDVEQRLQFWDALSTTLYWRPDHWGPSPWRRAFFEEMWSWAATAGEQMGEWNPLRVVCGADYQRETYGADAAPEDFDSLINGVASTGMEIRIGTFPTLDQALRDETWRDEDVPELAAELRTWGLSGFAAKIADGWHPMTRPAGAAFPLDQRVEGCEDAITHIVQAHDGFALDQANRWTQLYAGFEELRKGVETATRLAANAAGVRPPWADVRIEGRGLRAVGDAAIAHPAVSAALKRYGRPWQNEEA